MGVSRRKAETEETLTTIPTSDHPRQLLRNHGGLGLVIGEISANSMIDISEGLSCDLVTFAPRATSARD